MGTGGYVLVGLGYDGDGRPELDWAATEAQARDAVLRVVRAYDPAEFIEYWTAPPTPAAMEELRGDNEQVLQAAVAHTRRQWPDLVVHGHIAEGSAAQLLVEASSDAGLTVVGSRQLSTVGAMVLGSVSSTVVAMGDGPVVVVGTSGPSRSTILRSCSASTGRPVWRMRWSSRSSTPSGTTGRCGP
jgi:Universal stress protein UspA and related nucleotide-binding proteins